MLEGTQMRRKGLLEWKILAAIFAVLIVVSSALVSNTGIKDFFMNTTTGFGDFTQGSPFDWFSSFFSTPVKGVNAVAIKLTVPNMTLPIEAPANITAGGSILLNFKGTVDLNFIENSSTFQQAGSDFRFEMEMSEIRISGVSIQKMILQRVDFVVTSESTNITGTDDKIEIYDFSGDITITDHILLTGNVSKVNDGQWSID
jgi:hypothetical protein